MDNMFDFIKREIVESRLFRSPISLQGHSATELAHTLYMSLLVIELIRHDDESTARQYCAQTIKWGDFDHMRSGSTDVGNIISVLDNQDDYEDRMKTNFDISAPILQIKTYMRGVWTGSFQHGRDRQFFMNLETALRISDSTFYQVRRTILDWPTANRQERNFAISNIRRELGRHALRLDLLEFMPKV